MVIMGTKYLWTILTPFCERKPLYELQGKTVAVDLSCWICEAQNISEYQVQPKMYLRNLYFRTSYLLLMEVYPIFVLEGKAPELKYDTIAARNAIQFKGAKPKTDGVKTGKDRTRFHYVLKQCQEMLKYMGLVCLTGKGEPESFCAYLNQEGKFTTKHLGWEEVYSFEKFLLILTRWQLLNHSSLDVLEQTQKFRGFLYPECIKKTRTLKGVPSYEIVWSDKDNFFKGLIPDSQLLEIKDMDKFWSTIEPQNFVGNAYPKLVEDFRISKIKPEKPTRRKNKKLNQIDELNNSIKNISFSEPAAKKLKKHKKKINSEETTESKIQNKKINMETLDSFLKKAIVNNFNNKNTEFTSTPIKKRGETASVDLSDSMLVISNFEDENESDLSDILDGIMGEDIPQCFKDKLEELGYKIEDNNKEFHAENRDSASFFTNSLMENDLFQRTFDQKYMSSDEDMEDLEHLNDRKTNDSFDVPELPSLFERLKNRM